MFVDTSCDVINTDYVVNFTCEASTAALPDYPYKVTFYMADGSMFVRWCAFDVQALLVRQ
jgi:hypothetical protein